MRRWTLIMPCTLCCLASRTNISKIIRFVFKEVKVSGLEVSKNSLKILILKIQGLDLQSEAANVG